MSIRVTSEAIQVFGGYGFTDEYLVSRLYRGARYGSLGGGTSETLRDLIGKRLMASRLPGRNIRAVRFLEWTRCAWTTRRRCAARRRP